jgi:hypothetical protein
MGSPKVHTNKESLELIACFLFYVHGCSYKKFLDLFSLPMNLPSKKKEA